MARLLRLLVVVVATAAVAACGGEGSTAARPAEGTTTAAPPPPSTTTSPADPSADDAEQVGHRWIEVVDPTRPTSEVGGADGVIVEAAPERRLPTLVLYPAETEGEESEPAGGPYPVVVYAHGLGGAADPGTTMLRDMAAAGYVVVAPDFPETTRPARYVPGVFEQPDDLAAVLDEVLASNERPGDPLEGLVDPERVGLTGHSLGGWTAYGAAFNDCCRDARYDAVVTFAGVFADFPEGEYVWADLPLLLVHGDADPVVRLDQSQKVFAEAAGPRHLLTLHGEGHGAGLDASSPSHPAAVSAVIAFLDAHVGGVGTPDDIEDLALDPAIATLEHAA